jgi:starch-binding outer membrane protein, SusD/RagB family
MNYMKSKLKYVWLLSVITAIGVASCNDFLDRKPLVATLDDYHLGGLESQAFGLYVIVKDWAGFNSLPWLDFHSIRGDDELKGSSLTDGAEINTEFETFQYTKDDWATNTYWSDHYYLANQASKLISDSKKLGLTDKASLVNVAEAYFFRAYAYFELVKAYGEVPVFNYYYATTDGGIKAKSTVAQVYAQIDNDLDSAVQFLPATTGFPGRLVVYTAHALWAQTYLFRGNWPKVIEHGNVVKNSGKYSLVPKFYDIWRDGVNGVGKNSVESIFEIQTYTGPGQTDYYGTPWGACQNIRQGGASIEWNLGWGWNVPSQKLVDVWDASDPRKACTVLVSGKPDGGPDTGGYGATIPPYSATGTAGTIEQPYWNKKVYSDPAMRQATGWVDANGGAWWINHRVIRYADILLMLAEASNETGDMGTAEAMLEMVRARARNTGSNPAALPPITGLGQAAMRDAIKDERRWEFAMEGYRFYDLVRWGDASSKLGGLGYQPRCQYYPIPLGAINQSITKDQPGGVLVQNPNW